MTNLNRSCRRRVCNNDPAFWRSVVPGLTISDEPEQPAELAFAPERLAEISRSIEDQGYLQVLTVFGEAELVPLRQGLLDLQRAGLPATNIYLYDQPYVLFARLGRLIRHFLGERFALLPNFWAWHIAARSGARGWPAHQDCEARTRFPDGTGGHLLMSMSLWINLTEANQDNGCLAVLPRPAERHYRLPIENPERIDPQHGISLPVPAGSLLGWPQDLYHWSNRVTGSAVAPRLSLSLEFQNRAFAALSEPLLDVARPPTFVDRRTLVEQQFAKYRHMEEGAANATSLAESDICSP